LRFVLLLILALISFGCASAPSRVEAPHKLEHIYLEPVTNRTSEEALDVIFTQVANDIFSEDPRFKVDLKPIPDVSIVVKPSVDSVSSTAVGFDRRDIAREYQLTVTATVKLIRYGYKTPLAVFKIKRYGFYDAYGSASEVEEKRKECLKRIGEEIFREVAERLYVEGYKEVHRQKVHSD